MNVVDYISEIEGSGILLGKMQNIMDIARKIIPVGEEIEHCFVTNHIRNGTMKFENFWMFTRSFMLESKEILSETTNIDLVYYRKIINRYEFSSNDFDLLRGIPNERSRIRVEGMVQNVIFNLNAVGVNCKYLWEIIQSHIVPNLLYFMEEDN